MSRNNDILVIVGNDKYVEDNIPIDEKMDYFFVGPALYDRCLNDNNYLKQFNHQKSEVMLLEIHSRESREERYPDYAKWLKTVHVSKLMKEYHPDMVFSYKFPKDEIEDVLLRGKLDTNYWMVSFSYMTAWAVYMGYKEIHLYGICMVFGDDYIQKGNFDFWLGLAIGKGIKIVKAVDCDLLECKDYGYEVDNTLGVYMQKFMTSLQMQIAKDLIIIKAYLEASTEDEDDIFVRRLDSVHENFRTLFIEGPKFKREILDRHGIDIKPQQFDLGDKD